MNIKGEWLYLDLDIAIRSVARHLRYLPKDMAEMYFDDVDFHGLIYWYNDAVDSVKKVKKVSKNKDGSNS